jgi:hypothetical protein
MVHLFPVDSSPIEGNRWGIQLMEHEFGTGIPKGNGKVGRVHLPLQDGSQVFHRTVTIDLTFRIKEGRKKGYPLQVIPVKVGKEKMEPFHLGFANPKTVPQFPQPRAPIQNDRIGGMDGNLDAGGIAPCRTEEPGR